MAALNYTLTLDATAQNLLSVIAGATVGGRADVSIRQLFLQAGEGNTGPVYVGADDQVASTHYIVRIPTPVSSVPAEPFSVGSFDSGPIKLSDYWVKGTSGNLLQIGLIPF